MTPLQLKDNLIKARQQYGQGTITLDELYAAADAYIAALKEYKRVKRVKLTIPNRAYLIRAL